ncbi:MAG: 23S rRNA (uracil(1939)-C(5))-methyltransferase RlmD [Bacteroidales bacterium]|jgi:23S rRNA (uracil1939-C5)-methyltransferase
MSRKNKPFLEGIEIESVAAEGNALAHVEGKVLFVQHVIPKDVVDVQVSKIRKGYMEGYMVNLVKPSPHRIKPFCEHYGTCGGCKWQPLPYSMQLEYKQQQVADQLIRIGHLSIPEIAPIIASKKTEQYRNKLEYTFSEKRWIEHGEDLDSLTDIGRLGLGFHVSGYFDKVLDIKKCYLQKEPSNEIRNFVRKYSIEKGFSFYNLREQHGLLRTMIVRTSSTDVMLIMVFGHEDLENRVKLLDSIIDNFHEITSLYYVINTKGNDTINDLDCVLYYGSECIIEQMEELKFKIGPKSFYQTNSEQAYRLYSVVRDFALNANSYVPLESGISSQKSKKKPVIYDLYTGTGTIALFLSKYAEKVIGIEYVPEAIEDAKINAKVNGIDNSEFFAGDMKDVLNADFISKHGYPDLVVLDPPRAGIHPDVAEVLMNAAPSRIIYVSCNPASQARDLAIFSSMYQIVAVQPVDMFPHTHHVENVVSLMLNLINQ